MFLLSSKYTTKGGWHHQNFRRSPEYATIERISAKLFYVVGVKRWWCETEVKFFKVVSAKKWRWVLAKKEDEKLEKAEKKEEMEEEKEEEDKKRKEKEKKNPRSYLCRFSIFQKRGSRSNFGMRSFAS